MKFKLTDYTKRFPRDPSLIDIPALVLEVEKEKNEIKILKKSIKEQKKLKKINGWKVIYLQDLILKATRKKF